MPTLQQIADVLNAARRDDPVTLRELAEKTGLTQVTLRGLLEARTDPRLTTLMAVADELGLEVMLVPKAVAASIGTSATSGMQAPAEVPTLVGTILKRSR